MVLLAVSTSGTVNADFRPTLTFGVLHDGNVSVVGGGTGVCSLLTSKACSSNADCTGGQGSCTVLGPGDSDESVTIAFDFIWDHQTATSTFAFTYRPSYTAYRTFSELDYFGNRIVMAYAKEWSRASRFTIDAYAARTDHQGQTTDNADTATTFVPRTTETQANLKFAGTHGAGRRGLLDWALRGEGFVYEDVINDPATAANEAFDFNNSMSGGGRLGWRGEISERNTLGAAVDVVYFGYESGPGVGVGTVGLVGTYQASASWLIDYAAGYSRAESDGFAVNGISFNGRVDYSVLEKKSTLSAGARQVFAPGTGLGGATQDRVVWVSYGHTPTARGISGSLLASYSQRDTVQFGPSPPGGDTSSASASGTIGWMFSRFLSLNAYGAYVDQTSRNEPDPVLAAALETSYASYALFLRWAIRGR